MQIRFIGKLLFLSAICVGVGAHAEESRVQLQTRAGVTQGFLVTPPPGAPVASVILFTGGTGQLDRTMQNFLIRSRAKFAAAGFLVASVDVPSDRATGFNAMSRSSAAHAQDIAAVIAWLRKQAPVPVWLIGTSTGTISAANVAARLRTGGADGLVMTSTFVPSSAPPPPIHTTVEVGTIDIPTLFVHNKEDGCPTSQFDNLAPLMDRFTHAPKKALLTYSGGSPPQSEPCDALARHGYFGIEDQVIGDIVRRIKGSS